MNGPYVPIEELAKHFSVSISTIRGWVRKNHIPEHTYIRAGNTYRFSVEDVIEALSKPKQIAPIAPIARGIMSLEQPINEEDQDL